MARKPKNNYFVINSAVFIKIERTSKIYKSNYSDQVFLPLGLVTPSDFTLPEISENIDQLYYKKINKTTLAAFLTKFYNRNCT